jgi:hypothetical protein
LNPVSIVPISDQPANPSGARLWLILRPMTDWLRPLGVNSHLTPLFWLVMKLSTPLFHAAL